MEVRYVLMDSLARDTRGNGGRAEIAMHDDALYISPHSLASVVGLPTSEIETIAAKRGRLVQIGHKKLIDAWAIRSLADHHDSAVANRARRLWGEVSWWPREFTTCTS